MKKNGAVSGGAEGGRVEAPPSTFIERRPDGETFGKLPSEISPAEFEAAGHHRMPLLKVIRAKCADCSCYQPSEIRKCTATGCALWPYRLGFNPLRRGRGRRPANPFKPSRKTRQNSQPAAALRPVVP